MNDATNEIKKEENVFNSFICVFESEKWTLKLTNMRLIQSNKIIIMK